MLRCEFEVVGPFFEDVGFYCQEVEGYLFGDLLFKGLEVGGVVEVFVSAYNTSVDVGALLEVC